MPTGIPSKNVARKILENMVGPEGGPLVPEINDLAKSGTGFYTGAFHAFSPSKSHRNGAVRAGAASRLATPVCLH